MKINGVSCYQVTDTIADIVLKVQFKEEDVKKYDLIATTVWVTYDLEGNFKHTSICDEGLSANLSLTEEELKLVQEYIQENNLEEELKSRISKMKGLQIGVTIKRNKDGHHMKVVADNEAVLYVDNDKIGITDAQFYLEHDTIEIVR